MFDKICICSFTAQECLALIIETVTHFTIHFESKSVS